MKEILEKLDAKVSYHGEQIKFYRKHDLEMERLLHLRIQAAYEDAHRIVRQAQQA